ncbi:MAG: hypothetical protein QOI61_806 [Actinomycetota bacterium]|jgi:hypothetical protein
MLLGSGLLAVVADSATSTDNSVQSNELSPPAARLRVGILEEGEECGPATTRDETEFDAVLDSANLDLAPGANVMGNRVCLYNAGATAGYAEMQFLNVLDAEANQVAGTCDNAEASPQGGNDQSCGETDPGELSEVLGGWVRYVVACSGDCVAQKYRFWFDDIDGSPMGLRSIGPGEGLTFDFALEVASGASEQKLQAAQTDRLQFDINFILLDQEPPQ